MTKFMAAELSKRHLSTMNMRMTEGTAGSASTLDSVVHGWYVDEGTDGEEEIASIERKKVTFSEEVQIRHIPAEGASRRTPNAGVWPGSS